MAGRIRRDDIETLRTQADIVAVVSDHTQLKRAGSRMKGLCPFHSEKTPSFTVDAGQGFFHCLSGETKVMTWRGTRPIRELAGATHRIMTTGGRWVDAPFFSYGVQPLWAIHLSRNGVQKTLYATDGHRWLLRGRGLEPNPERVTTGLRAGDRLAHAFGTSPRNYGVSAIGVMAGFTWGDGTAGRPGSARALFNDWRKDAAVVPYFPANADLKRMRRDDRENTRYIDGLPTAWKESLPDLDENAAYLHGWLAGYFAADGCVSKDGQVTLASASRDNLEFVRTLANRLGIGTYGIKTQLRTGYLAEPAPLHSVTFVGSTLRADFFVLDHHRERYLAHFGRTASPRRERKGWVVRAVERTDRVEEVYCAEVPKTHAFALEDNILTGNCFGCGEGGDVYDFLQKISGLSFTESVEQLARRTGFTLHYEDLTPGQKQKLGERSRLVEMNQAALELFREWLYTDEGEVARDYLKSRGFGRTDADRFQLGYAPNTWETLSREMKSRGFATSELVKVGLVAQNDRGGIRDRFRGRLIFPVFDAGGDPIGFGGRILPGLDHGDFDPPKYYNSPETPLYRKTRVLYGLSQARTDMAATGEVLICEGYTDVMALHQAGFGNAVATCGTAVGAEHFRVLSRYVNRVVLAFDSDAAGVKAAEKAWEQARDVDRETSGGRGAAFTLRVLVLPDGADPADYVQREGVEALRARVEDATPVVPFLVRSHLSLADLSTETGRTDALRDAVALLGEEPDPDLRRAYARTEVADVLGVSVEWVEQTAARQGVTLDRHEGAAVPSRLRRQDRGAVVRVTRERASHERAVLRAAVQHPEWLPDGWYQLAADDFQHPTARAIFQNVQEAGGAGVPLDALLEAAPDDELRGVLRAIALEDPDPPDTEAGTVQQVSGMLADRVEAELAQVVDELGRINPSTDPDRFRTLNSQVFELEQRRRELRVVDRVEEPGIT